MSTSNWVSYHLFPKEPQDKFLVTAVGPFLAHFIWANKGTRAFFIRYADESGPHIRLRMKGEADWLKKQVIPKFEKHFKKKGDFKAVPYVPEPEKFGGAEALAWCEEHFHISSRVVLDRLSRDKYEYGDALFDALKLHTSAGFAAGFTRQSATTYFDKLANNWIGNFFSAAEDALTSEALRDAVRSDFEATLAPQFSFMQDALKQFRLALEESQHDPKQPEWLRWLRGNELIFKGLGKKLDTALPHLLHLTNNRLGINNQDEAYLMYVLGSVGKEA